MVCLIEDFVGACNSKAFSAVKAPAESPVKALNAFKLFKVTRASFIRTRIASRLPVVVERAESTALNVKQLAAVLPALRWPTISMTSTARRTTALECPSVLQPLDYTYYA